MGRHKFGGGAVQCEVCPNKVTHQNSVIVGRKASGTARVIHKTSKCQRKWKQLGPALMASWPENRKEPPNTPPPPKPAREKRPDPPAPKPAPQPAPLPAQKEAAPMATVNASEVKKHYMRWKPELTQWLLTEMEGEPFTRYWSTRRFALLKATAPSLLVDETGRAGTQVNFAKLCARLWARRESVVFARSLSAKYTEGSAALTASSAHAAEPPKAVAPAPRLVPVDTRAIISENNELRAAIGGYAKVADAVAVIMKEVVVLMDTVTHGPPDMATAAKERLITLSDLSQAQ